MAPARRPAAAIEVIAAVSCELRLILSAEIAGTQAKGASGSAVKPALRKLLEAKDAAVRAKVNPGG